MAKTKRNLLLLLACVFLFSVAALVFTACSAPSYTVTFLVQNDTTGEWEQYATASSDDGSVTLPNNPSKTNYVFRNWYDNTDFTGEPFTGENVEGDMNVYAYFVPTEISINVTKSADEVDEDTVYMRDLEALKEQYEQEALDMNLTFDGWYTGADYDTLWTSSSDVDVVYGRFMAQITYDNGFETYEPFTVQAGETISEPTLEYIQKYYMDDDDIYYVVGDAEDYLNYNEDGILVGYNEFDFSQPVSQNMTITVLWKTPYLDYNVNANGTYSVIGTARSINGTRVANESSMQTALQSFPVISLPAYVSACDSDNTGDSGFFTTAGAVESVVMFQSLRTLYYYSSAQKIIVQDGIKWLYGLRDSSTVEEVVLPSTLKGMERALINLTALSSITIPEGTEVVINSLWYENYFADSLAPGYEEYDFEIEIPASVKNMAMVPGNLTFADGSPFYKEDNAIYLNEGDDIILINSYNVTDGELHIPEGVTGIQAGAFFVNYSGVSYVYLPSTFSFVNLNAKHTEYRYALSTYKSNSGSTNLGGSALDFDGFTSSVVSETQRTSAYMLYNELGGSRIQKFIFNSTSYPAGLYPDYIYDGGIEDGNAFSTEDDLGWMTVSAENYLAFAGEAEEGVSVTVYVSAYNTSTEVEYRYLTISLDSGDELTEEDVLNLLAENEGTAAELIEITSLTQFGREYEYSKVTSNVYFDLEYRFVSNGFTFTVSGGEATVTGLSDDAVQMSSGYYFVNITSTVTYGGVEYPVTAIADGAFKGEFVGTVIIPSSITYIGESAFEDCNYLTLVTIQGNGLQYIGAHAFEDTGFTTITLPLANVTYIGPYAFKSASLQYFIPAEGESAITNTNDSVWEALEEGKYYLFNGLAYNSPAAAVCFIIRYTGTSVEQIGTYDDPNTPSIDINVRGVDVVAMAAGTTYRVLNLGASTRLRYDGIITVVRYGICEGSVYYLPNVTSIVFGIISKIETNAFTDIDERFWVADEDGTYSGNIFLYTGSYQGFFEVYDSWLTAEQITSIASKDYDFDADDAIFEDGWFNGVTTSDENYEDIMAFMSEDNYKTYNPYYNNADGGLTFRSSLPRVY